MNQSPIPTPDGSSIEEDSAGPGSNRSMSKTRWIVIPISILLCIAQAIASVYSVDVNKISMTSSLLGPLPFGVLLICILVVNPLLRLIGRIRPLSRAELMTIFVAMFATTAIPEHGLTAALAPLIVAPNNPHWNTPQRGWAEHLEPQLRSELYIQDGNQIVKFNEGLSSIRITREGKTVDLAKPPEHAPWSAHLKYGWHLVRAIPWGLWMKPLSFWAIFIAAGFGMFYFLTRTVMSVWADREKLIFPLVKIPESLIGESTADESRIPRTFRSGLFWLGFGIVCAIMSWQGAVVAGLTGSLKAIPRGLHAAHITSLLESTIFEGLGGPGSLYGLSFEFTFIAIGVAFLIPLEVSFSVWFYFWVGKIMMLVSVWMGFGQNMSDFPTDGTWTNNPLSAQGGGALFLFSAVCLLRCVRDSFLRSVDRPWADRRSDLAPLLGLFLCLSIMACWLWWNHLPLLWAMVLVIVLMLLMLAMMRMVAEGGIFGYVVFHTSFFHLFRVFALGKIVSPLVVAPMMPICAVLFKHYGMSAAPNLLNAEKACHDMRLSRTIFGMNLYTCVLTTIVVSMGFTIFMAYLNGAQTKHPWFWNRTAQLIFDDATQLATAEPTFEVVNGFWYIFGAGWAGLTMILRRTLFWLPHPIGYVMLVNTGLHALWFSFFVGWICKKMVVRFGGRATFDRVRRFFIGVVVGQLATVCIFQIIGLILKKNMGVS